MKKLFTAKYGIDIPGYKEYTNNKPIINCPVPSALTFPMSMHIGANAKILVDVGDKVKAGTVIGDAEETFSPMNESISIDDFLKRISQCGIGVYREFYTGCIIF